MANISNVTAYNQWLKDAFPSAICMYFFGWELHPLKPDISRYLTAPINKTDITYVYYLEWYFELKLT